MNKLYFRLLILSLLSCLGVKDLMAQVLFTNTDTVYTQNFDGMGTTTGNIVPSNWIIRNGTSNSSWTSTSSSVSQQASGGTPTSGGIYNWGHSSTNTSDRALGIMTSGSVSAPAYIFVRIKNNGTTSINNISINFDIEKYRTNSAAASVSLHYSLTGSSNWVSVSEGDLASSLFPTGTNTHHYPPVLVASKTDVSITNLNIEPEEEIYIRWTLNTTGSNSQGVGLDNVRIAAKFVTPICSAPSSSPEGFSTFSTSTENTIDLEWLDGNGAGRIIKMNTSSSFTDLDKGDDPTASTTYTGGEQVIFNGTGSGPISISNLLPNTTYYFKGYEYCSPDRVYNNSGDVENIKTDVGDNIITLVEDVYGPFCSGIDHLIHVEFTSEGEFTEAFKVQLSDANGDFLNLNDNIIGSGTTSPISAIIPASTPPGLNYLIRVIYDAEPYTVSNHNGTIFTINATPTTPTSTVPSAVCLGNSISVTASGSSNASAYTFWDSNIGGNQVTSGVSGNTLSLDNNTLAGTYTYFIQAENGSCVSERQEVTLEVIDQPSTPVGTYTYSNNPSCGPATIDFPSGYYFQTSANGTSTTYPTSSSYILNANGTLYVRAFNGSCWSDAVASDAVVVSDPISISSQPTNKSIAENRTDTFKISATNVSQYQWQENDGNGWSDISGANTNMYIVSNPSPSKNGYTYRVILTPTGSGCDNVISNVATLTVTAPAAGSIWNDPITGTNPGQNNPFNSTIPNGFSKDPNLTVSGINRFGINGNNANDRYNTNSHSSTLDLGKYIFWILKPNSGYEINLTEFKFTTQSNNSTLNSIVVRSSVDNFTSNLYSATIPTSSTAHTISLSINNVVDSIEFRIYAYGADMSSRTFSINDFDFIGLVLPAVECELATPSGTFEYSANPSCGPATVTFDAGYYFQTSPSGTSTAYPTSSPFEVTSSGKVYVREYDGTCWSEALASTDIVINAPISITTQPTNISIPSNGTGSISVVANNASSYQWQENDGNGWTDIEDATSSTLSFNSPSQSKNGYTYRVVLSASPCSSVISNVVTLSVTAPIAGSIWSNPITGSSASIVGNYTIGQTVANNITVSGLGLTGATKATANDRYSSEGWTTSLDLDNYFSWTITPNSGYALNLSNLNVNLQSSGSGPNMVQLRTSYDNFADIIYSSSQAQSGSPVPHNIGINIECINEPIEIRLYAYGTSAGTFSVNDFDFTGLIVEGAATPNGTFSYSDNPSCGPVNITFPSGYYFQTSPEGTSTAYPTSSPYILNSTGKVYVRNYNGTCWSDAVESSTVEISTPSSIISHPQNRSISTLGSGSMSINATNVTSYQWQVNDGSGWMDIPSANSSTLTFNQPSASLNGNSYRVVLNEDSPCALTSNPATLTVVEISGPCVEPSNLSTTINGNLVTFNWEYNSATDIYVVKLKDMNTGQYAQAFSPRTPGFTATIPSGTYQWFIASLCNTEFLVTGNASNWIQGGTIVVP